MTADPSMVRARVLERPLADAELTLPAPGGERVLGGIYGSTVPAVDLPRFARGSRTGGLEVT